MDALNDLNFEHLAAAILVWLFVSLIVEELCNVLFKWKLYAQSGLNNKGFKTPIIFAISFAICASSGIDIFQLLLAPIKITIESGIVSYAVSAALLNGGSGTVFRFLERFREGAKKVTAGNDVTV
ncbi:MAG: hypothetical protein F4X97_02370 [Boseongicola sp. SB0662_bin_57]|nr:hypothetical protein [Boseongicola sp. SB0662_bin_57]